MFDGNNLSSASRSVNRAARAICPFPSGLGSQGEKKTVTSGFRGAILWIRNPSGQLS